jgi:hypothetical protein
MKTAQCSVHHILLAAGLGLVASLTVGLSAARGQVLFSESFQYPVGPLNGDGPPAGSPPGQTAWTTLNGFAKVGRVGLKYPGIDFIGGCLVLNGNYNGTAIAGITPVTSGVVWIGFLQSLTSGSPSLGYATLNLNSGSTNGPGFGVLFDAGVYGIDNGTGRAHNAVFTKVSPGAAPAWLVIECDFDEGMEYLYINPPTDGGGPSHAEAKVKIAMDSTFQEAGFDEILLHDGDTDGLYRYDEVRVGMTFHDIRTGD